VARWKYIILFITILFMLTIFLCCVRTVGIVWKINDRFGKTVITMCALHYIPIYRSKKKLLYFSPREKLQLVQFRKKYILVICYCESTRFRTFEKCQPCVCNSNIIFYEIALNLFINLLFTAVITVWITIIPYFTQKKKS